MHYPSTHDAYEDTKPCPVGRINLERWVYRYVDAGTRAMPGIITPMSHQKEPNTRQYNTEMHWWHGGEGEKKIRLKGSGGINGHGK